MKENTEYPGYFPSMYQITKEIYDTKEKQISTLEELHEWVSSYTSPVIPKYEIKDRISELMNK